MATAISVDGPCNVKVDTGSSNALEQLGYTADGVDVSAEPFNLDVPGDENGGSDGIPIDIQHFGQVHRIRMELTKFDEAVAAKVHNLWNTLGGGTAGTAEHTAGALYSGSSKGYRVLLEPTNRPRNYLFCVPQSFDRVKGSKYTRLIIEWIAYPVSGVLHNTTTA